MPPIGSDVANIPTTNPPAAPTYCAIADVARILHVPQPSAANDEGEPATDDWNQTIIDIEGQIDRIVKTSWRSRRVKLEYHDATTLLDEDNWLLVPLRFGPVKTLSAASGDTLEVRQGGTWESWLGSKTEGVGGQYWLEEPSNFLRLRRSYVRGVNPEVRISYRYGHSDVPQEIRRAAALLAAASLNTGVQVGTHGHGGEDDRMSVAEQIADWRREAYSILADFQGPGVL